MGGGKRGKKRVFFSRTTRSVLAAHALFDRDKITKLPPPLYFFFLSFFVPLCCFSPLLEVH